MRSVCCHYVLLYRLLVLKHLPEDLKDLAIWHHRAQGTQRSLRFHRWKSLSYLQRIENGGFRMGGAGGTSSRGVLYYSIRNIVESGCSIWSRSDERSGESGLGSWHPVTGLIWPATA